MPRKSKAPAPAPFRPATSTHWTDARQYVVNNRDVGVSCPCCDQFAKVYRRGLSGPMVYALIVIERWTRSNTGWLHVPEYLSKVCTGTTTRGGDWAKMVHWGLLQEKPVVRMDGAKHAGYYKITQLGLDFVNGRVQVPAHVFLYNKQKLERPITKMISVEEALRKKFNYAELMADAAE